MRILLSGASGLVGSALQIHLRAEGHKIYRLVRNPPRSAQEIFWNPESGLLDTPSIENFDACIHLSGENIGEGRWTAEKKKRLRESRILSTQTLVKKFLSLKKPPSHFLCASAVGFYGDRGDETLDEQSIAGQGFLPQLCEEWEQTSEPLSAQGIRVAHLRFGIILSSKGGALSKMLTPFKLGLGGIIGSGKQWMSWIALEDTIRAIDFVLEHPLNGPINLVSPQAVTNEEFTKTLGECLHRPTLFKVPTFAAKLAFGEMAEGLLLASTKAIPKKLEEAKFHFLHPSLSEAIHSILKKNR